MLFRHLIMTTLACCLAGRGMAQAYNGIHKYDGEHPNVLTSYLTVGGITYLTLDTMCEENRPEPGDYLVRVHVKQDGSLSWERVHMNYSPRH